jgi:hypothetical protein
VGRRFAKSPHARAWPACLYLFLVLAILPAVSGSGCGNAFVPQTTTGTGPPTESQTTEETNPTPLDTFEFDLLPADADNALQTWVRVAGRAGFDPAAGLPFEITLGYSPSGSVLSLSIEATTGDNREVWLMQGFRSGDNEDPHHVSTQVTPPLSRGGLLPLEYSVYSALQALGAVGPNAVFAKLPPAGDKGHYIVSFFGAAQFAATREDVRSDRVYVWDGHSFRSAATPDAKSLQEGRYASFSVDSVVFSTTTTTPPPPEIFMYMTTSPYVSAGTAVFFVPLPAGTSA